MAPTTGLLDASQARVFFDGTLTDPRLDHPEGLDVGPGGGHLDAAGSFGRRVVCISRAAARRAPPGPGPAPRQPGCPRPDRGGLGRGWGMALAATPKVLPGITWDHERG